MDIGKIVKIIEVQPERYPATRPVPQEPSPAKVTPAVEEPVPV